MGVQDAKWFFLGLCGPDATMADLFKKDLNPQVAAQRVQGALVAGLDEALSEPMVLISTWPVGDYPKFPHIIMKGAPWSHREGAEDYVCGFINIIFFKHVSRFITVLAALSKRIRKKKHFSSTTTVVIYSLNSALILAAHVVARFVSSCDIFIIVPDLPKYMEAKESQSRLKRALKWLDERIISRAVRNAKGLIVFAETMSQELGGGLPYVVIEGVAPSVVNAVERQMGSNGREFHDKEALSPPVLRIAYAGSLVPGYGIELLIDVLEIAPTLPVSIHVFGRGPLEQACLDASKRLKEFHYHGFISPDQLAPSLMKMDLLLNLRNPRAPIARYAFPSKILEYMVTGVPVLTSKMPSLPDEYLGYVFTLDQYSSRALVQALSDISSIDREDLINVGDRARRFVLSEKSGIKQARRILRFVESVT